MKDCSGSGSLFKTVSSKNTCFPSANPFSLRVTLVDLSVDSTGDDVELWSIDGVQVDSTKKGGMVLTEGTLISINVELKLCAFWRAFRPEVGIGSDWHKPTLIETRNSRRRCRAIERLKWSNRNERMIATTSTTCQKGPINQSLEIVRDSHKIDPTGDDRTNLAHRRWLMVYIEYQSIDSIAINCFSCVCFNWKSNTRSIKNWANQLRWASFLKKWYHE